MATLVKYALRINQAAWDGMNQTGYTGWVATINAWVALIPVNLVTADEQWQLDCYKDWGATGLTEEVKIEGKTTDATRNIIIDSPASERHNGILNSGFKLVEANAIRHGLLISTSDVLIQNIQVSCYFNTYISNGIVYTNNNRISFKKCIFESSGDDKRALQIQNGTDSVVENCLVVFTGTLGAGVAPGIDMISFPPILRNNTVAGFPIGIRSSDAAQELLLDNNVCYNNTTNYNIALLNAVSTNNAASDATAPGLNPVNNITSAEFTDSANYDFSLPVGSLLKDAGVDRSIFFTDDIAGVTRG